MNKEEFEAKAKEIFSKSAKVTKDALEKAGDKVQDFTDKSVTKLQMHQLETKRDCKYEEMGIKLSQMLIEGAKITFDNPDDLEIINNLQEEVINLSKQIREKEQSL